MDLTDQELDALEAAARAATRGPPQAWRDLAARADGGAVIALVAEVRRLRAKPLAAALAAREQMGYEETPGRALFLASPSGRAHLAWMNTPHEKRNGRCRPAGWTELNHDVRLRWEAMARDESTATAAALRSNGEPTRASRPAAAGSHRASPSGLWCPVDGEPCDCGAPIGNQCTKRRRT